MSVLALVEVQPSVAEPAAFEAATGRELAAEIGSAIRDAERKLGLSVRAEFDWNDWSAAAQRLDEIADRLTTHLFGNGVRAIRVRECASILSRVQEAQVELARARSRRSAERRRAISAGLRGLRGAATVEQLFSLIPAELARCGFTRAWVSEVDGSEWKPVGFHDAAARESGPPRWFTAIDRASLVPASHEGEMVRRRRAVLVTDTAADELVDPLISESFAPRSYVAAPVVVDTRVIAFLHADRPRSSISLDEEDLDVVTLFAEAVSHALQRVILSERLERLRKDVRTLTQSVGDMIDDRCFEPVGLGRSKPEGGEAADVPARSTGVSPVPSDAGSRLAGLLTLREQEVLRMMATGETNCGIARQLVISEGTVKSHVKNVLRKLHAANRAQAVSRYYRLVRPDGVS